MAILTVDLFNQYSDNYFLSNNAPNNILNGSVRKTLPQTIINTETSLNAMLNGRLYQKYSPSGNIQFKDTTEQNTLYSVLTECVLYRIQTGEYINLHNTYSGNVNGTNNFSSGNSNVIGLRNDIRDKLVFLGLYQSGSFSNATLPSTQTTINSNVITAQQWLVILSNLASTNQITFNGYVQMNGEVWMEPSLVQLGNYGDMVQIFTKLNTFQTVLQNYTNASVNGPVPIPTITSSQQTYHPLKAEFTFNTSEVISQIVNTNLITIYPTIKNDNNTLTFTLQFDGIVGLHIEPQYNNGDGWFVGVESCILNPNQTTSTTWNVSTTYPSWSFTFDMESGLPSFSFTITTSPSQIQYTLLIQGYFINA